jgi:hypothetical protein
VPPEFQKPSSTHTALVLFVLTAIVFIGPFQLSESLNDQSLVLNFAIFLALVCGGVGTLSLDYLLTWKRTDRK